MTDEVFVRQRNLYRQPSLGGPDVDERLVASPRKLRRDGLGGPEAETGHGLEEASEPFRSAVDRIEGISAGFALILWLAGL